MDKHTLSHYGWIVVLTLVLSVMIAMSTPFGHYIKSGINNVTDSLIETNKSSLSDENIGDKGSE